MMDNQNIQDWAGFLLRYIVDLEIRKCFQYINYKVDEKSANINSSTASNVFAHFLNRFSFCEWRA